MSVKNVIGSVSDSQGFQVRGLKVKVRVWD